MKQPNLKWPKEELPEYNLVENNMGGLAVCEALSALALYSLAAGAIAGVGLPLLALGLVARRILGRRKKWNEEQREYRENQEKEYRKELEKHRKEVEERRKEMETRRKEMEERRKKEEEDSQKDLAERLAAHEKECERLMEEYRREREELERECILEYEREVKEAEEQYTQRCREYEEAMEKYKDDMEDSREALLQIDEDRIDALEEINRIQAGFDKNKELVEVLHSIEMDLPKAKKADLYSALFFVPDQLKQPVWEWREARVVVQDGGFDPEAVRRARALPAPDNPETSATETPETGYASLEQFSAFLKAFADIAAKAGD